MRRHERLHGGRLPAVDERAKRRDGVGVEIEAFDDPAKEAGVTEHDAGVIEAENGERFERDEQDLDVGFRACPSDMFDPELMELVLPPSAGFICSKDLTGITESERPLTFAKTSCNRAGDE